MSIMRFLHEYWGAVVAIVAIFGTIGLIVVQIWSAKRKPDKPESEKIGYKLKITIRNLGWKIKNIPQILGRRQTRAELVDLSGSINGSLETIQRILALHHQSLIDLKKDINKPMTEEQMDTHFKSYTKPLREMIEEANKKRYDIAHRSWKGMKPLYRDEKIRKRI